MAFHKRYYNNEGRNVTNNDKSFKRWAISDKSVSTGDLIASTAISILLIVVFVIKVSYSISDSDIQSICQITAGLSGLTLAIPLFLKDFEVSSNFWKLFYLIAITFLVATFIGVFSFLQINSSESKEIVIYLWFLITVTISINVNNIVKLLRWGRIPLIKVSFNPLSNFITSFLILFASLFFAKRNFFVYGTIILTVYGFYLTLSLMSSTLVELFSYTPDEQNIELKIKQAIKNLTVKYKSKPITEQVLIDLLRHELFINEQELISRSKVLELITEMDLETEPLQPKITIYPNDHNFIIPRWTMEFDKILQNANPKIIVLHLNEYNYGYSIEELKSLTSNTYFSKDNEEKIYSKLCTNTQLSVELLKDNNSLCKKYKAIKFIHIRDRYYSSNRFLILVDVKLSESDILVTHSYKDKEGDYLTFDEYEFLLECTENGEVFYDNHVSIEVFKNAIR